MMRAVSGPSLKTACVPHRYNAHPRQPCAATRSFAMVGLGGRKSAAEPVIAAGSAVQGALAGLYSARRVGPFGLLELAVLFGFIVLLAVFVQAMTSVRWVRAVRRS